MASMPKPEQIEDDEGDTRQINRKEITEYDIKKII